MKSYRISPLEPLVFGDGRPFSTEPGALSAGGLDLPMPSTLVGALRSALGRESGASAQDFDFWLHTMNLAARGPLLATNGGVLIPAPGDMVVLRDPYADEERLVRARPGLLRENEGTDMGGMKLCMLPTDAEGFEPTKSFGPKWLTVSELDNWYADAELWGGQCAQGIRTVSAGMREAWNRERIALERRAHVAIDPVTLAHETGHLFTTTGTTYSTDHYLLAAFDGEIPAGLLPLGGERRLAAIAPSNADAWSISPSLARRLAEAKQVAMVLATPAHFALGALPERLSETLGVDVQIESVICRRRVSVSGWDLVRKRPKPSKWLAPAGSVYFLRVTAGDGARLAEHWLQPVSDDEASCRDGFGLATFFPTSW